MIDTVLRKIFGSANERALRRYLPMVEKVSALEPSMQALSDEALRAKTDEFKKRLADGQTVDQLLPEAFAAVREAARRTVKMRHFDVQILGGVVLHEGKIAEMATGEGKTLVATLPVYLNALAGRGAHVVTVNDYLARRDRLWMGPIYEFMGLTIGVIQHDMDPRLRQQAYGCDITYGTNNEYGFDYLRDNMVLRKEDRVQRPLYFGIVDEVDSILIDEARTPLIISGPAEESTDLYYRVDLIIPQLSKENDYKLEEKTRSVSLTEDGVHHAEKLLNTPNLYDPENIELLHHVQQALRAHALFKLDVDYVIKEGQVIIVDEFTGRLMPGRRYSDGLHQALEAKEKVKIERENQTLATITFQNYFRMYKKLAGMTGTAETEAMEFKKIYSLDVMVIPPNRTLRRTNHPDVIYRTEREKFAAVVNEIIELNKSGRPVLVGTISIDKSEHLSAMLQRKGIAHTVLNAKYHEKEAEIIARAGQNQAVTIATNMAGRGTDIVLGEGVADVGGLHVLGTERHESRRIDNQLRGRSGRQGDPGSSRFYLALEDDLLRIFGSDRLSGWMQKMGMEEGQDIQHPWITKAIENAQRRVEMRNFEIRKNLLEYDNVMNKQREVIYAERQRILEGQDLVAHLLEIVEEQVDEMVDVFANADMHREQWDLAALSQWAGNHLAVSVSAEALDPMAAQEMKELLTGKARQIYEAKESEIGAPTLRQFERMVMLHIIDAKWKDHLRAMDELKEGIGLRAYGQRDPLVEYQTEAFDMFTTMIKLVKSETMSVLFHLHVSAQTPAGVPAAAPHPQRQQFIHPEPVNVMTQATPPARPGSESDAVFERHQSAPSARARAPIQPVVRSEPKVGRNDPCPCGSGKKYKKCCGVSV